MEDYRGKYSVLNYDYIEDFEPKPIGFAQALEVNNEREKPQAREKGQSNAASYSEGKAAYEVLAGAVAD